MICATCEQPNPDDATHCSRCSSIMPPPRARAGGEAAAPGTVDDLLKDLAKVPETVARAPANDTAARRPSAFASGMIGEGTHLGPRYEIVRLLGKGGMGSVYLAYDRELSRLVALKVVALHLAGEDWVLERFKREIHLSSLVTHPNVLRVFDLGEHDGLKFLTMQYVEGDTLDGLMRREKRLPLEWSLAIFRQLCGALGAAHQKGVLHRDLKPQNVLVDKDRTAYLTDFGLATASTLSPMTQAGALMGTPHYMSPEQVKGLPLDPRSDLFSLGVMLYELLAGVRPYAGDSVYDLMMARVRDTVRPVRELNPEVPAWLQAVLERCLAVEPDDRYQSAAEILADLDAQAVAAAPARRRGAGGSAKPAATGKRLAVAAALLVAAAVPFAAWRLWPRTAAPPVARTVLIADFENRTGEDVFNGTLEPAFGLTLEGASFVSAYSRASAQKLADRLKLEGSGLAERRARLVAQREGISTVVAGFVDKEGAGYRVGVRAVDGFTGSRIAETEVTADEKGTVLAAASKAAAAVRAALGDVTPIALQLREAETYSAGSLEAAHEYAHANELAAVQGKYDEARQHYLEAIRLDPGLGRAYAGLAVMEGNRSHHAEATRWFQEAQAHVDRMSEREKHRTRGAYHLTVTRDADKAIEAYQALVAQFPADNAGLANLGLAHVFRGEFAKAAEYTRKALALYPQNVPQRNNLGFFAMYAGDLDAALKEQEQVLGLNPAFVNGHIGLAMALAAAGRRGEAEAAWRKLAALGPSQASAAAEGLADLAAFEGRLGDARAALEPALAADLAAKEADGAARKLAMLAEVALARGDRARAAEAAGRATAGQPQDYVLFLAGRVLVEAGQERRGLALADQLAKRVEPAPRQYAELLRGEAALLHQKPQEALDRFKAAGKLLDGWLVHEALGRAYLQAGAPAQAADELEACQRRRGEVTDVFVDNVPTWRLLAPVAYWRGRALEAQRLPGAPEAYREFLAPKAGAEEPIVQDARRRVGGG